MKQPRSPSESHTGSYGDFFYVCVCVFSLLFSFYFSGTVFFFLLSPVLPLIALTLEADGIDPEIN